MNTDPGAAPFACAHTGRVPARPLCVVSTPDEVPPHVRFSDCAPKSTVPLGSFVMVAAVEPTVRPVPRAVKAVLALNA